ncbi:MAG: phosphotransferase [Chloroflexota bacterium]
MKDWCSEKVSFGRVGKKFFPDRQLKRVWPLTGGVSAQTTALEFFEGGNEPTKVVVRCHGEIDRSQNPNIAADEFMLLQQLKVKGIPVPTPYYLDQSCEILPTPYLILQHINGRPEFDPSHLTKFIHQVATHLADIHRLDITTLDLSFLPKQGKGFGERPQILDDSLNEGEIRDRLEMLWPLPTVNQTALLHGDFWPGNVLWQAGQLIAIIDWEDAHLGDPVSDLANSRLETLWAFGVEAMHQLTAVYQSLMPTINLNHLPYWDLCAALRPASNLSEWGLDPETEQRMRDQHKLFITQAFKDLGL